MNVQMATINRTFMKPSEKHTEPGLMALVESE